VVTQEPTKPIKSDNRVEIPFTRIRNGNRYPNGSPLSALTMLFNQQGIMYDRDYLYKEHIEAFTDKTFKKEVGATTPEFGPIPSVFAGDMTSTTRINGPGCSVRFYSNLWYRLVWLEEGIDKIANINTIFRNYTDATVRRTLDNGQLIIALVRTRSARAEIKWTYKLIGEDGIWRGDTYPHSIDQNTKWVVIYGYNGNDFLAYDPSSNRDETFTFNLIEDVFSIRRR
jgi:hypothetical protein